MKHKLFKLGLFVSLWIMPVTYNILQNLFEPGHFQYTQLSWLFNLLLNMISYGSILLPGFVIYKYLQTINYFEKIGNQTILSRILSTIYVGSEPDRLSNSRKGAAGGSSGQLAVCAGGLLAAYLVWGLLQEKIMTQVYLKPGTEASSPPQYIHFTDSQFLVFCNRVSAFATAALVSLAARYSSYSSAASASSAGAAPLCRYAYCSVSNVLSAWCQYEALKFVSFPVQVLSKSCKVIPVLLMSRAVSGGRPPAREFVSAAAVSLGTAAFLLSSAPDRAAGVSSLSPVVGAILLCLYLTCDSFTSSWQGKLFSDYHVTPVQMMCYVNLLSVLLTGVALAQQPTTASSVLLLQNKEFVADVLILSACSAAGQLLIYRTIALFGPVTFTIVMTLRQAVSILLSCIVYGHPVSWLGAVGLLTVFAAVGARIYYRERSRNTI